MTAIEEALARGEGYRAIQRRFAALWGLSERQVGRYISEVLKRWSSELSRKERETLLVEALMKRRHLFRKAMKEGNWNLALRILDSEARLLGLMPSKVSDRPRPRLISPPRKVIIYEKKEAASDSPGPGGANA